MTRTNGFFNRRQALPDQACTHEIGEQAGALPLKLVDAEAAPAADEISLELGDFLPRIPVRFLKHAEHDAKRQLRFKISELSAMIAQGATKIAIAQIAPLCPDIFREDAGDFEAAEIYFPWKKLAGMIDSVRLAKNSGETKSSPVQTPALDRLASKRATRPAVSTPSAAAHVNTGTRPQGPSYAAAEPVRSKENESLANQRDAAIKQRDQVMARIGVLEANMKRRVCTLIAERDLAISEKRDALAFIALLSRAAQNVG